MAGAAVFVLVAVVVGVFAGSAVAQEIPPCASPLTGCLMAITDPTTKPDKALCCAPMEKAVSNKTTLECLCTVFNDDALFKSLGLKKENAMTLPSRCGMKVDFSVCGGAGTPPPTKAPEPEPVKPAPPTPSDSAPVNVLPPAPTPSTHSGASQIGKPWLALGLLVAAIALVQTN